MDSEPRQLLYGPYIRRKGHCLSQHSVFARSLLIYGRRLIRGASKQDHLTYFGGVEASAMFKKMKSVSQPARLRSLPLDVPDIGHVFARCRRFCPLLLPSVAATVAAPTAGAGLPFQAATVRSRLSMPLRRCRLRLRLPVACSRSYPAKLAFASPGGATQRALALFHHKLLHLCTSPFVILFFTLSTLVFSNTKTPTDHQKPSRHHRCNPPQQWRALIWPR